MEYGLVAVWIVAYAVVGLAGLPLAARAFPRIPGRGAGFALPLAVLALAVPAYWVGHLAYPWPALAAGGVVLLVASALAGLDRDALREGRAVLASGLDVDRRAVGEVGVVFALAFVALVAVRAVDPAVAPAGGEKFLDFSLLQSLSRSGALPPADPWFAGEPVRYYYGGHLVASLFGHLTGTPVRYAYNLALAGAYATLVAAAYDLAGGLAALRGESRRLAGVAAAFLVGFAANLSTAGRLLVGWLPTDLGRAVAGAVGVPYGEAALTPGAFFYWDASRVIPGTVTEFPLFAWLNGDLHAHMTGTPFLLTSAALAAAYYRTPADERRRRLALAFGAVPLVAGFGAVVNTWSFPSHFGLIFLAAATAPADPLSLAGPARAERVRARLDEAVGTTAGTELGRLAGALAVAGVAGLVGTLAAAPFLLGATGGSERTIELLATADRTGLGRLLLVHGAFVVPFGAYLADRLSARGTAGADSGSGRPRSLLGLAAGVVAVAFAADAAGLPVAALSVPLLVGGWVALRHRRGVGFEAVLILAGAGLVTVVELVYLAEQAGPGRFNTVFKTYAQVWLFWAVAAGVVIPALARRPTAAVRDAAARVQSGVAGDSGTGSGHTSTDGGSTAGSGPSPDRSTARTAAAVALAAALVVATGSYGVLALANHFPGDGPADAAAAVHGGTTDATAALDRARPEEAAAIDWLDAREGRPTIVSAPATSFYPGRGSGSPPGMYRWGSSPAASMTGVPTVAGWGHEVGYRGPDAYYARVADVDTVYTGSPTEAARLLRTYDVAYVWVGPAERARYGTRLSVADVPGVTPVHRSGSVTVYAVRPATLPGGEAEPGSTSGRVSPPPSTTAAGPAPGASLPGPTAVAVAPR